MDFLLRKGIRCFPFTLHRKKIEKAAIAEFGVAFDENSIGKSGDHHNTIVIKNFVSKCFPSTLHSNFQGVISTPKMELKFSVQNNPFSGVIFTLLWELF